MHDLCVFPICFCSKIIFDQNFFLYVEINLTTRGPLYTCLVLTWIILWPNFFLPKDFYQKQIDFAQMFFTTFFPKILLIEWMNCRDPVSIVNMSCWTRSAGSRFYLIGLVCSSFHLSKFCNLPLSDLCKTLHKVGSQ